MAQWYVNELSKLADISVRTLHHYDKIGLLKPSVRKHNGYRLYSEKDLLKLQQILALKYFGFELATIQLILKDEINFFEHVKVQSRLIDEKINSLIKINEILKKIIEQHTTTSVIAWEKIHNLVEVYNMASELDKSWASRIFSADELNKFSEIFTEEDLNLFSGLNSDWSEEEKINYKKDWEKTIQSVQENLKEDPNGSIGRKFGKKWIELVNKMYGTNYELRNKIWDSYKNGKILPKEVFSPEAMRWIEIAIGAYYQDRGIKLLELISKKNIENTKTSDLKHFAQIWKEYKQETLGIDCNIEKLEGSLNPEIKKWLQKLS